MTSPTVSGWQSISRRLITYILLLSSVMLVLATGIQLLFEYRHELMTIEDNLREIETSHLNILSEGIWSFNERMLQVQLLGMLELPAMRYLEIRRTEEPPLRVGELVGGRSFAREFPLQYQHRGREIPLGSLYIVVGLDEVYARLWDRVVVILVTQGVQIFFIAAFVFFIFHFLVGRPLIIMADYARSLNFNRLDRPLVLPRRSFGGAKHDEIGLVVESINEMRQALLQESAQREKMAAQLRQAQKMEAVGTLAGGIAHDFNNILTPIIGYCELAKLEMSPAEQEKLQIDEILKAVMRARDLVRQILTFSRREDQQRRVLELQPIIGESLKLLRASLPANIAIRQQLDSNCGPVLADLTQIQQVILNLGTNAAQAMEEKGGVLEVSLRRVEIALEEEGKGLPLAGAYACLTVKDTGSGMDAATQERIFEPYFTTKEQGKGTGLGLALVHGIVKSHGGQVTLHSEPGRGTTFRVYLPLAERPSADPGSLPALENHDLPRGDERVLVIDDEEKIVALLTRLLNHLGYKVVGRTDSRAALDLFARDPRAFDLVISDQTMPGLSGDELARALRKIRPDLPLIICTGFSPRMTEEQAIREGIQGYIMKPFRVEQIASLVRRVLDANRQAPDR